MQLAKYGFIVMLIGSLSISAQAMTQEDAASIVCKLDLPSCDLAIFEPLKLGQDSTDKFYLETTDHKKFLLRVFNNQTSLEDRKREISVNQLTSAAHISPELYWSAPDTGLVMDYIDHPTYNTKDLQTISIAVNAGTLLAQLHKMEGFPEISLKIDRFPAIAAQIKKLLTPLPLAIQKTIDDTNALIEIYRPHISQTAVHNDVHEKNLIYDGHRFWLIDWEEAGLGDPFIDLATLSVAFGFTEPLLEVFLDHYFEEGYTPLDLYKLDTMRCFVKAFYGFTILQQILNSSTLKTEVILDYLKQRDTPPLEVYLADELETDDPEHKELTLSLVLLNDFENHFKSPQVQKALDTLSALSKEKKQ